MGTGEGKELTLRLRSVIVVMFEAFVKTCEACQKRKPGQVDQELHFLHYTAYFIHAKEGSFSCRAPASANETNAFYFLLTYLLTQLAKQVNRSRYIHTSRIQVTR